MAEPGRGGRNIDSVGFRQLLRTSVDFRDMCGRKTEDARCGIMRKTGEIGLNCRKQGELGEILHPSAPVGFRGLPWNARKEGGGKMGSQKLRGNAEANFPKWRKTRRGGRSIAYVSFRGRPWTSATCEGGR